MAPTSGSHGRRGVLVDGLLCCGLVVLGLAFRLPELWNIPVFTDEWDEIAITLDIVRDGARPLTNADPYYGALTSYLMAGFFLLSGVTIEAPRQFALTLGVLQIVPTYLLGLEAGRAAGFNDHRARLVGLLSGLLLAAAGAHIVLNSHLAWANSTTPLFTTTALWLMLRSARQWQTARLGGWAMVGAGLCLGLALQTHIMVSVLIVGVSAAALLTVPRLALSRWGVLTLIALGLGYANMIAYNVLTDGETFRFAHSMSAGYAGGREIGYVERLGSLVLSLSRLLVGALDRRDSFWAFIVDPLLLACTGGAIAGVAMLALRRKLLFPIVLLTTVLLLPLVNNRYEPLFSGRYLSPLLPVLFAGLSTTLVATSMRLVRPAFVSGLSVALAAVFGAYSLVQLHNLYGRLDDSGRSNARVLETMRSVRTIVQPGEIVYLDNRLRRRQLMEAGSGDMERVFGALLDVTGTPYEVVAIDDSWQPARSGLIILASRETARSTDAVVARLGLTHPRGGQAEPMEYGQIFQLYRAPSGSGV